MRVLLPGRLCVGLSLFLMAVGLAFLHDSPAASSALIQGDADCSGEVGATDALSILRQTAFIADAPCGAAADTNCDNEVDARDALNVLRFVAGLTTDSPEFCTRLGDPLGGVVIEIDPSLEPSTPTVESLDGGPPQPVDVAVDPNGVRIEFVRDEVVYKAESPLDLQEFLERYDGTVIRDGTTTLPAELAGAGDNSIEHGYYLVRIDATLADTENLAEDLVDAGISGRVVFSSEDAARIMAIAVGDPENRVQVSGLMTFDVSNEHPLSATTFLDADTFDYFTSGSNLNIGVTKAWSYLRYQGVVTADRAIPFQAVRVAVIDGGFALDETTGIPSNGNVDFFPPGDKPIQYDAEDEDYTAGGTNPSECSGGSTCPWHGTGAFGTCCAIPNNNYGSAGSGGAYVVPILIKAGSRISVAADAVRQAELLEADIITMSFGYTCGTWCGWFDGDIGDALDDVGTNGRIPLAAAGNDGVDIGGDDHFRPCEFVKVVCVGSIDRAKMNLRNYGSPVDIWGVERINSTVTPETAARDADDIGTDELYNFNGTSAATPFVAGIVALMKSLDPTLTYVDALDILKNTSNPANDAKVTNGYVNALNAVLAARGNQPPIINNVRRPESKATYGYSGAIFRVDATDPEAGAYLAEFANSSLATFSANGVTLCASTSLVYLDGLPGYQCQAQNAPLGTFNVEVSVTDPFGAQRVAEITEVTFVNTAPQVQIFEPLDGATFFATQSIEFGVDVYDPEQVPFPQGQIVWSSSLQGDLGFGYVVETALVQGTHTVTVTATDEKGVSVQDSITLHILSGAGIPTVEILSPADNSTFGPGEMITFVGQASDPEDGPLTGNSLDWYSDIDGYLGSGEQLTTTVSGNVSCPDNAYQPHVITLRATDSDAHEVTDEINIAISIFC